ncbi:MAG: YceI family protein [Sandaracinaceae bacterium]|nr:YceI family protein [Sandaracinaceae bacterium]
MTRLSALRSLLVLCLLAVPVVAYAQARTFTVGTGSRIGFRSVAPLETINGTSSRVTGSISVNPANLSTASGRIEVPVSSLRTGEDLRDEHLHGAQWLNAASFPTAVFEITGVEGASSLTPDVEARVTVVGRFTLHGQTRNVRAETRVKIVTNDGPHYLSARSRFNVNLPDYGVTVPAVVRAKVSDTINVTITLRANAS